MDLDLLKFFCSRDNFNKYRKYVKRHTLLRDTDMLLSDFEEYYRTQIVDTIDIEHFILWFKVVRHPMFDSAKHEAFEVLLKKVQALPVPHDTIIKRFIHLDFTAQVRDICDNVIDNATSNLTDALPIIEEYMDTVGVASVKDDDLFITDDLKSIIDDVYRTAGAEWRLEDLNVSCGPLRGGDFVIVCARPETGKTTFLCSEFVHLISSIDSKRDAVIFNNEEDGRKIYARLVQAATGMTMPDMAADDVAAMAKYVAVVGRSDRIKVVHKEGLSTREIDRILTKGNYALIGLNILDKVTGFEKADNDVSRMRSIAQWARGLANKHNAIVFGLMQADASGEGKAWLDQSQLYGSKTGVQGEADVIIMIGNKYDIDTRYIAVCKNKLPGGPRSKPSERHGKFEVWFDPERARYASKRY